MEAYILHETTNLYLYQMPDKRLEIRLKGATHAVCVGQPTMGVERAKQTMERLEAGIDNLRKMYQHY